MSSLYLSALNADQRMELIKRLHEIQKGLCFICEEPVDLLVHADSIDVDHVEPVTSGGKDDPTNFALTHASCNRSKQATDLRVARVLARFGRIQDACQQAEDRGANLNDVLTRYQGAQHEVAFRAQ